MHSNFTHLLTTSALQQIQLVQDCISDGPASVHVMTLGSAIVDHRETFDGLQKQLCDCCGHAIDPQSEDYIKAECTVEDCPGSVSHVECATRWLISGAGAQRITSSAGAKHREQCAKTRPATIMYRMRCWAGSASNEACELPCGGYCPYEGTLIKSKAEQARQAEKARLKAGRHEAAAATVNKPTRKHHAGTEGPARGGVAPVGQRHTVDVSSVSASDRLGVAKVSHEQHVPAGKTKQLVMCCHGAQCPTVDCGFVHTEEELRINEIKHKDKLQLQKAQRTSRKAHKKKVRLEADLEGLPEDAMALYHQQRDVRQHSAAGWQNNGVESPKLTEGSLGCDGATWTEMVCPRLDGKARTRPVQVSHRWKKRSDTCDTSEWSPHASRTSFATSIPTEAADMVATHMSPAAKAALRSFKLSVCVSTLIEMGISKRLAEIAAYTAGGSAEVAGNLCFTGTPEHEWPYSDVDLSEQIAKAMSWMLPPHNFAKPTVEAAIEVAAGDLDKAFQALSSSREAHSFRHQQHHKQQQQQERAATDGGSCRGGAKNGDGDEDVSVLSGPYNPSDWEPTWDHKDIIVSSASSATQQQEQQQQRQRQQQQQKQRQQQQLPQQLILPKLQQSRSATNRIVVSSSEKHSEAELCSLHLTAPEDSPGASRELPAASQMLPAPCLSYSADSQACSAASDTYVFGNSNGASSTDAHSYGEAEHISGLRWLGGKVATPRSEAGLKAAQGDPHHRRHSHPVVIAEASEKTAENAEAASEGEDIDDLMHLLMS